MRKSVVTASYVYTDMGGYGSYVQIVIIRRSKNDS